MNKIKLHTVDGHPLNVIVKDIGDIAENKRLSKDEGGNTIMVDDPGGCTIVKYQNSILRVRESKEEIERLIEGAE